MRDLHRKASAESKGLEWGGESAEMKIGVVVLIRKGSQSDAPHRTLGIRGLTHEIMQR